MADNRFSFFMTEIKNGSQPDIYYINTDILFKYVPLKSTYTCKYNTHRVILNAPLDKVSQVHTSM